MEEITTRFEIIRLAVNLGDFRTIDLQCEKLRSLSLDDKLNEIIDLLESRNYRQALYEMKHYARSLDDEFFASKSGNGPAPSAASPLGGKESAPPDLGLFAMEEEPEEEEEEKVLDLDDILKLSRKREVASTTDYQASPEFESAFRSGEEAAGRALSADLESEEKGEGPEEPDRTDDAAHAESETPERSLTEVSESGALEKKSEFTPVEASSVSFDEAEWRGEEASFAEESVSDGNGTRSSERYAMPKEQASPGVGEKGNVPRHPPISYISQKFRNMIHQFPPVEQEEGRVPEEVERMQKQISSEGYTEEEIEAFLKIYQRYKEEGKRFEAAMVLLLAAATESKFAQFLLARELFRGEILQQDHAEAFTQINTLADQNFAEAICDLGQFYEHGIGIGKDRQMALLLYEEAADMGVARAQKHYDRLKNSRGLLGVFKKVALPKVTIPLPRKK